MRRIGYIAGIYKALQLARRVLGVEFADVPELANAPRYLAAIVPAANTVSNASEWSRFYQLLLNEGELDEIRICEPRTIQRATSDQSYLEFDLTLGIPTPVRWGSCSAASDSTGRIRRTHSALSDSSRSSPRQTPSGRLRWR